MAKWVELLEIHFNKKKKAFLIFDDSNILRYLSGYAKELLGLDDRHIGFITFSELFPPSEKTPQLLIGEDYSSHTIQIIVYTTPSGLLRELRISKEIDLQSFDEISGYIVWIEARSRDISGVYRKISTLHSYFGFDRLFDQNDVGFILLNSEGIIEKYNSKIKSYLSEPGDWKGQNIYGFSFIHRHGIDFLISQCMKGKNEPKPVDTMIKTPGYIGSFNVRWSGMAIKDLDNRLNGIIITASQIRDK